MASSTGNGSAPKRPSTSSVPARTGLPPGDYFQLVPQGAAMLVVRVTPEKVKSTPAPVLTRKQLEEALHRQSIPTVPGSALTGYLNSLHALPGFESHASAPFSRDPGATPLSRSGWRGALGEVSAQRGGFIPQRNLNEVQHNHPIFDLRDYRGGLKFPELLLVAKHGGGIRGNALAAGIAGGRGAAGGALVSVAVKTGLLLYAGQRITSSAVWKTLTAGGAAGFSGAVAENWVMANAGQYVSRGLINQGLGSRLATGVGRGLGGVAAGGLAAPVFVMTSLALDDEEHSRADYTAMGTRAFVSGSLGSAIAAGAVGALWGTEVPVLGNIVGFLIGFAGFYIVDALAGAQVEQTVRQSMGGLGK